MPGRNAQVSRIYCILNLLEGAPQGLTVSEVRSRVGERGHEASARTIYRDLEALSAAGFPLFPSDEDNPATRWTLEKTTTINKSLVLSTRELVALYLAKGMLIPLKDTPFYADLESIFKKIDEKLGSKSLEYLRELSQEIRFEPSPRWGLGLDPDILETLRSACSERQLLEVQYASVNSQKTETRKLGPHYLYLAKGSLYLIAEDFKDKVIKVFACPRMKEAKMLDEPYKGEIKDPEIYFASSFGIFQAGQIENIKIQFSPPIASFVKERTWHQTQRITNRADGSILLSLEVGLSPELIQWVLGFGPAAFIIEPELLRVKVASAAEMTAAQYLKRKAA